MTLNPGTRMGAYEVVAPLGAGGMGEVYRARDTRLNRDVAIKVLPDLAAGDHERRKRFEREAQLLASLNHPNIAQIYGLEEVPGKDPAAHQSGHLALAMELVSGENLAVMIARGAPSTTDALAIARQIAAGLEAAHEKGIIHRDLKPANVMLAADGQVKILDFGLGKAIESDGTRDASNSPTITIGATQAGMILGTAAYMSPEQAKGRVADKRSDVWAFGCILYELLTGRRAFAGEDVSETLASVLKESVDLGALPAHLPRGVRLLVERCLTRDRAARLADVATARFLLTDSAFLDTPQLVATGPRARSFGAGALVALGLSSVVLTAAGTYWLIAARTPAVSSGVPTYVSIEVPAGDEVLDFGATFAVSPDGRRVVYSASSQGVVKLFERALDSAMPRPLAGTEGATIPFFSPDGRSVAFFSDSKLKKTSIGGGTVETLATVPDPRGGAWGDDGYLYFPTTNVSPIYRVAESGGEVTQVTKLRPDDGEISHRWPQVLPGGNGLVFSIWTGPGPDEKWIAVQPLPSGEHQVPIKGGTMGRFFSGYLLYTRADDLFVVPMDATTLTVDRTSPTKLPQHVLGEAREGSSMALSEAGVLAYLPGGPSRLERRIVWMDANGATQELPLPQKLYEQVAISPDGRTAIVQLIAGAVELWLLDLERNTLTPFVTTGGSSQAPVWTSDGKRVIYRATRKGVRNLYWKATDGSDEERLTNKPGFLQTPSSLSSDASGTMTLAFSEVGAQAPRSIWALRLDDKREAKQLPQQGPTGNPQLSPDGKWLAVEALGSGTNEVYLQPFPGPGARVPVSSGGGAEPRWSSDSRAIYYFAGTALMAVNISASPSLVIGKPRVISSGTFEFSPNGVTGYSIGRDGRFLRVQNRQPEQPLRSIQLVLNWREELRRLVK